MSEIDLMTTVIARLVAMWLGLSLPAALVIGSLLRTRAVAHLVNPLTAAEADAPSVLVAA